MQLHPMKLSEHLSDMFGTKPFWSTKNPFYKELRTDQEGESVNIKDMQKHLLNAKYKTDLGEENLLKIVNSLDIKSNNINIKATTTDGLGFIGQGKGIACQSVALIQ